MKILPISLCLSVIFLSQVSQKIDAQIVPDNTLGPESSMINSIERLRERIEGGATRGENLFHSFQELNIGEGLEVYFANPEDISNIFSRITGSNPSNILGTLGVEGNANLFLINPNGIIWGENARLDLGGSFIATTANSIDFADGTSFAVRGDNPNVNLTISIPIGLGLGENPGDIVVRGTGNNLNIPIPEFELVRDNRPVGLEVLSGQTLALLGGNITLDGGNLTAPTGRIELGSVGADEQVGLTPVAEGWQFNYQGVNQFQNINLSQAASVDTSGDSSGAISFRGQQININDGSAIVANTLGDGTGGDVNIVADSIQLARVTSESFVSVVASDNVEGQGGDINITTKQLSLADGAQIRANVFGSGTTGEINIAADKIEVTGANPLNFDFLTTIETSVAIGSNGEASDINVNAKNLQVIDGARILTDTFDSGNGGNLKINAETIVLRGISPNPLNRFTGLSSRGNIGNGGDTVIKTSSLEVADGAEITVNTRDGSGGSIEIEAKDIEITGTNNLNTSLSSGLIARTEGNGQSGNIFIQTDSLRVADGARIIADSVRGEDAGNININANTVELTGSNPFLPSRGGGLATSTIEGPGNGGDININTINLKIIDGSQIRASTIGNEAGKAGNINIKAQNVEVRGVNPAVIDDTEFFDTEINSGIIAFTVSSPNNGGEINIKAQNLHVAEQGRIDSTSFNGRDAGLINIEVDNLELSSGAIVTTSSLELGDANTSSGNFEFGDAGVINIIADRIINDNASITATSELTGGGRINIEAKQLILNNQAEISTAIFDSNNQGGNLLFNTEQLQLLNNSNISTSAQGSGDGGNIEINADNILSFNDSDITATAVQGSGGNITITADSVLGLAEREAISGNGTSDVDASSQFGQNGNVTITNPQTLIEDPILAIREIPTSNIPQALKSACGDGQQRVLDARHPDLPESADDFLDTESFLPSEDFVTPQAPTQTNQSLENLIPPPPQQLHSANHIVTLADGRQFLVVKSEWEQLQQNGCHIKSEVAH